MRNCLNVEKRRKCEEKKINYTGNGIISPTFKPIFKKLVSNLTKELKKVNAVLIKWSVFMQKVRIRTYLKKSSKNGLYFPKKVGKCLYFGLEVRKWTISIERTANKYVFPINLPIFTLILHF